MTSTFLQTDDAPKPVLERWQQRYRQGLAEAEGDPQRHFKLLKLGTWPVVLIDLLLLLVIEFVLSLILLIIAVAVIGINDNAFSGKLAANSVVTNLLQSAEDWSLSPTGLAIGAALTQVGIFFLLYWRVVAPRVMTWADLGLGPALRDRPWRAFAIGLGLGVGALVLGEVIVTAVHAVGLNTSGQENTLKSVRHASTAEFVPFAFTAAITAPIAEETFFRGYVFRAMTIRYGIPVGLVVSCIAFGMLHLLGGVTWEVLGLVAIGGVLAYGYSRTGNPITNMTAHMLNNLIGLIALYHSL
jgi:membrane protease YdiL (CAAX protease family)